MARRRWIRPPEAWCVALAIGALALAWIGAARGWDARVVASAVGLLLVGVVLVVLVGIVARGDEETTDLAQSVDRLARSVGTGDLGPVRTPRDAADQLDAVRRRLAEWLPRQRADLSNIRAAFDGVGDAALAVDGSGTVVLANRVAEEFFADRGRVAGRTLEDLLPTPEVAGLHAGAIAGKPGAARVTLTRPTGRRVFEVFARPVALEGVVRETLPGSGRVLAVPEPGVVLTLGDVTELSRALELRTDFVANASHELRTPLASIRAAAETIADHGRGDAALVDRSARIIAGNVERLEEMVRDLLELSRLESPDVPVAREPVALPALVAEMRELFAGACASRRLEIALEHDEGLELIDSDPRLIALSLRNLIDNATKHAHEGTTIVVGLRRREGGVRLSVADQGQGIPFAQQHRIFERFYQVDAARTGGPGRRGTGLGLAIVRHAVKRLGGTARVESVWKQGTTIVIDLPEGAPGAWSECSSPGP